MVSAILGSNLLSPQFVVPYAAAVRKGVNGMTKYKFCKSKNVFEYKFNEKPKRSGQVRFYCDYEHIAQLHRLGLKNVKDFVAECAQNMDSETTSKKLLKRLKEAKREDEHLISRVSRFLFLLVREWFRGRDSDATGSRIHTRVIRSHVSLRWHDRVDYAQRMSG